MRRPIRRTAFAGVALGFFVACSGDDATGPGGGNGNGGGSGSFTITLTPAAPSLAQNGSVVVTIAIGRSGGFGGAVGLAVEGVPAGLTPTLAQASTTAASTTLDLAAAGTLSAGTYNLTVRGSASGMSDQTASLQVTVTAAGGGGGGGGANVSLDFAGCAASSRPIWFAYQDGNGSWTHVTGIGAVYSFSVTAARAGYAWVTQNGNAFTVTVQLAARSDLPTSTAVYCPPLPSKNATGSVAGLGATDQASIWMGGGAGLATQAAPNFTIVAVAEGEHDLWAWRRALPGQAGNPDRGLVRRDQNVAANGSVGALDFNGAESFTPASAQLTIAGIAPGEFVTHGMGYYSGSTCRYASLYQATIGPSPHTMFGVPAALQRGTDYHQIAIGAIAGANATRSILEWFHALTQRTVTLPAAVPVPTITTLAGPYLRQQAAFALPAEYMFGIFNYGDAARNRSANITATTGWAGGSAMTLTMPDFTAVGGWNPAWAPATGSAGTWILQATGTNITSANLCAEGLRIVTAQRMGDY